MLNAITLIGRMVADPELRYTPSGLPVANITLAVDRDMARDENGNRPVDFIDCVLWRQQAEFAANFLGKGRLVAVDGRLQIRPWTAPDGTRRRSAEVVANRIVALDRPRETEEPTPQPAPEPEPEPVADDYPAPPAPPARPATRGRRPKHDLIPHEAPLS